MWSIADQTSPMDLKLPVLSCGPEHAFMLYGKSIITTLRGAQLRDTPRQLKPLLVPYPLALLCHSSTGVLNQWAQG